MKLTLKTKQGAFSYDIIIGSGLLSYLTRHIPLNRYSNVAIITDSNVARHCLQSIQAALPLHAVEVIVPAGEQNKNIKIVKHIWKSLQKNNLDRSSLVINLGGGMISDMGGFAAATYLRGIDFVNIPTTLLAQVDASVGGKTGIDFDKTKNIIGSFAHPQRVLIDTNTLDTLPDREFVSGFAEVFKHGLIADKRYFTFASSRQPREFSPHELIEIISRSCSIKSSIVKNDGKEANTRKVLNFGHTIGHAVESVCLATRKQLLHGEAVSIGIVAEAQISYARGLLTADDVHQIEQALENAGLPTHMPRISFPLLFKYIRQDKKNKSGAVRFTLLTKIGKAIIDQEVDEKLICDVINKYR